MQENTPFNHLKETRHGKMLYNARDAYVGRAIELYGEFCQFEVDVFSQIIRPGDIAVDAGANIGAHTLYFARTVGSSGLVIAFEPQRIVFQTLCANMALNSITNALCFQQGLSDRPGQLQTMPVDYSKRGNFGGLSLGSFAGGEIVDVGRLDRILLPHLRLIKIDVEGMELQVLRGGEGLIQKHKPVLYVENDREEKSDALMAHLESIGYRIYVHHPPLYNPNNFFRNSENVFGTLFSQNLLCFHRSQPQLVAGMKVGEIHASARDGGT